MHFNQAPHLEKLHSKRQQQLIRLRTRATTKHFCPAVRPWAAIVQTPQREGHWETETWTSSGIHYNPRDRAQTVEKHNTNFMDPSRSSGRPTPQLTGPAHGRKTNNQTAQKHREKPNTATLRAREPDTERNNHEHTTTAERYTAGHTDE